MKRALHILAAILSVCLAIGALDLSGITSFFPDHVAKALAIIPPIFLAIGHAVMAAGDQLDDGQKNNSFPGSLQCHPLVFLTAAAIALAMTSCESFKLPEGLTVSGFYLDAESGAKAGLSADRGGTTGRIRVPIRGQDGAEAAWLEVSGTK